MVTKQGGKREGAGRPRTNAATLRDNKLVERQLKAHAEQGWEVLATSYPNLMRAAIGVALGNDTRMPNVAMLRTLLELMVKVVGSEPDQADSVIKQLVGRFIDRTQEANKDTGRPPLDGDSTRSDGDTDGRESTGATPYSGVSRVDSSI